MSRLAALGLCLTLLSVGCQKNGQQEQAQISNQTQAKPIVAIVPVIDRTTDNDISWNLSDELTSGIRRRLIQKDQFYLLNDQKVRNLTKKLNDTHNPFGTDLAWAKKIFQGNEFVVFLDLLEHNEIPKSSSNIQDSSADLNMAVRIRILDLRRNNPEIVLQEIISESHHLPKQFTRANFNQVAWGKENYHVSPLGLAHDQLCKEITNRIEDYINLASSH
jgi:hypothetical protein